jgi:hypothetical protein
MCHVRPFSPELLRPYLISIALVVAALSNSRGTVPSGVAAGFQLSSFQETKALLN